jgi:dihydrofolate reductase
MGSRTGLTARKLDWLGDAGLHLMGRATYEEMAGFWPTSDDEYAKPTNDIPKVVFSRTLTTVGRSRRSPAAT